MRLLLKVAALALLALPVWAQVPDYTASGSITAANGEVRVPLEGRSAGGVTITGTWVGTFVAEITTDDGTTWTGVDFWDYSAAAAVASVTANDVLGVPYVAGASHLRIRASAWTSGTATVKLRSTWSQFVGTGGAAQAPSASGASASQPATLRNTRSVSAANTAVTASIAAVAGQSVHLYSVAARCSAGSALLEIKNGVAGSVIYDTAATEVGTTTFRWVFDQPLSNASGAGMDIVLGACGASNTGTLIVQASQF